jgi:hypothetical protein
MMGMLRADITDRLFHPSGTVSLYSKLAAMMSFIDGIPLTTGSRRVDLLVPNVMMIALSCAPDVGFLSKYSGIGLAALAVSFT